VSDRFGGDTVLLSAGDELGFDVVILDQPSHGRHRWIPWASPDIDKFSDIDRVGRVTLTDEVVVGLGWPIPEMPQGSSWVTSLFTWLFVLPLGFVAVLGGLFLRRGLP